MAQMSAALAASDIVRSAIRFGTSLLVARGLGRDAFGRWTLWLAIASALTVAFDLGLRSLLTREAGRDESRVGALMVGALTARLALFLPIALAICFAVPALGIASGSDVRAAVVLTTTGLTYGCAAAVHQASPRRLAAVLSIETAGALAQAGGTAILVLRGAGVADLLVLAALVQGAQALAALVLWRAAAPGDRLAAPSPALAWGLLRRSWPFALSSLLANAQARVAPLLLGALAGAGDVASFGVAVRLESVARRLAYAVFGAAFPIFAGTEEEEPSERLRSRFDAGVQWFAAASGAALVLWAAPLVRLTYGPAFSAARWPLVWAGIGLVPSLVNSGREVFLYATGREQTALRWGAVALAVQVAGCVLLVPRFGASGAMAALAAGEMGVWLPVRNASAGRHRVARTRKSEPPYQRRFAVGVGAEPHAE
ncbi:MAG: lipopolysaccharide biosynthesis protein [Betaproteobacteria bacterium]